MKSSIWQVAMGVFIGNALFALVAWFIVSATLNNMRYDEVVANMPASTAEAEASLAATCVRYREALGDQADPELCPL